MKSYKVRMLFVVLLAAWAVYSISPSLIYFSTPKEIRNSADEMAKLIPDWLPSTHVKLGLDLQGGVQLVLGVNTDGAVDSKLARIGTETQRWADEEGLGVDKTYRIKGEQKLRVELKPDQDAGDFKAKYKEEYPRLKQVDREDNVIDFAYDDEEIARIKQSAIEQAERVIRNRVDKWGVSEPVINRRQADNSILVQLPGFRDPTKAKDLLGRTAQLYFKIVDDDFAGYASLTENPPDGITVVDNGGQQAFAGEDRDQLIEYLSQVELPPDRELYFQRENIAGGRKAKFTSYVVEAQTSVGGDDVLDAFVAEDTSGLDRRPIVSLRFTGPGGKRFGDVTGENVNRRLGIVLDDEMVSAPNIQTKIANGEAQITLGSGGYNEQYEEANGLALILKSGALPATIEVLEERQVGASLGPELADQGIRGVILGLVLVLIFMVIYYRRPGLIACLALVLNGVFLLACMAGFGFALTLPGIAGFVLTLGMAVDANVLINERIRYELREGKNAKKAVEVGFQKVFWTIVDANVTTLIAALVLLETNSSGPIRGFAMTLMVGLIVSMFTSLYCTKLFFEVVVANISSDQRMRAWLGGKAAIEGKAWNFNFLRYGKLAMGISIVAMVVIIGTGSVRGLNWGVDFAGGTEMMVGFGETTTSEEIKDIGESVGIARNSMTTQSVTGEAAVSTFLVRFGEQQKTDSDEAKREEAKRSQDFQAAIINKMADKKPDILQVDFVGPQIGKELQTQGMLSVLYAIGFVLLYIGLRFDMRFGPGAVVKMLQDIVLIFGFYIFAWRSFDLTSVAAFLTVVGYSVNDTIVIYDRIRENITTHVKRSLFDNINISLNECLTRTINTSVTTIVALTGILVFGGGQIWNFAMAMTIGVIVATLSSQFLASSFVLWLEHYKKARAQSKKNAPRNPAPARG